MSEIDAIGQYFAAAREAELKEQMFERRVRAIAREEIEANEERLMHEAMHGEIASPPAVEAPAAGSLQPFGGITIRADEPNIVIEGLGRPDLSIGSELADMTALARRLAEALNQVLLHDAYKVPFETYAQIEIALAEARKHKLIE